MSHYAENNQGRQLILSLLLGLLAGAALVWVWGRMSSNWAFFLVGAAVAGGVLTLTTSLGARAYSMMMMGALYGIPIGYNIVFGYRENVLRKTFGNGFPIDITDVFIFPLIALWFVRIFVLNLPERTSLYKRWTLLMAAMLVINVISAANTPDPFFGYSMIFVQIKLMLIFLFIANTFRDAKVLHGLAWAAALALFTQGLIGVEQKLLGVIFTAELLGRDIGFVDTFGLETSLRVAGTLAHPNGLAMFLNLLLPTVIFYALSRGLSFRAAFLWFAIGLALITEIFTGSRGGWVAFASAITVGSYLWLWKQGKNPVAGVSIVAGIGVFGFMSMFVLSASFRNRLLLDDHGTAELRGILVDVATNMISANPFTGVGLDHYTRFMGLYDRTTQFITSEYNETVHNTYLLIAAETGIFSLLLLAAIFILALLSSYRLFVRSQGMLTVWSLGIFCGLITWLVHSLVNHANFYGEYPIFMMFGLIVAMEQIQNRRDREEQLEREKELEQKTLEEALNEK